MSEARITSKGRITLPMDIRDRPGLKQGDRVRFIVEDDGRVRLLPAKRDVSELFGILPKPKRALSIQCSRTVTFDPKAAKLTGFELLR